MGDKMSLTYFIILGLLIYFIYLLIKYSGSEKPEYELTYFRDKEFIKYPPIVVGYLNNKKITEEQFIATALDFVLKGNIELMQNENKTDYIFQIVKKIDASDIEIKALKVFFNGELIVGNKQNLKQFKKIMRNEKLLGNYGKVKRSFNTEIRELLDSKQEVERISNKTNKMNIVLCFIIFTIMCHILRISNGQSILEVSIAGTIFSSVFLFGIFSVILYVAKTTLLGYFSWNTLIISITIFVYTSFLGIVVGGMEKGYITLYLVLLMMGVIIIFDDMIQRRKTNLANVSEMIKGLRKYILEYSNIKEYDIDRVHIWDEYYVYGISLKIKKIK